MLSKSKLLSYRQCPKRLWLEKFRPELAEVSGAAEAAFARGHAVGDVAQAVYGPGELIFDGETPDFPAQLDRTRSILAMQPEGTMFEATFSADEVLVMSDVLIRTRSSVRAIEVKSATYVKGYYIEDCAVQSHVMDGAGTRLDSIAIAHIDTAFEYRGDDNYQGLFREVDVSKDVASLGSAVPQWIAGAKATLGGNEPDVRPGKHCGTPFQCPFYGHCNKTTAEYPITILLRLGSKKAEAFRASGFEDIRSVPREQLSRPDHLRVYDATRTQQPFIDLTAAQPIKSLGYPRFYLDFETINFAVPIWRGAHPYQQIPFQWSIHIESAPGVLEHAEFLNLSGENPARTSMEELLKVVGSFGPILVYSGFERGILNDMACRIVPDLAEQISNVMRRLVDLLPIARDAYYHPAMMGSWSIKALLPTMAPDLNYDELEEVKDGGGAQSAFIEAISMSTTSERRAQLRGRMLKYCGLDSLAMVRVAHFFA